MKRFFLFFVAFLLCFSFSAAAEEERLIVVEQERERPDPRAQARVLMRRMTLEEKVYQLFMVAPEALTGEKRTTALPDESCFSRRPVGGVILFGQNIVSEAQLRELIEKLFRDAKRTGAWAPFVAVDEEGGDVSRVANKLGYDLAPAPNRLGQSADEGGAYAAGAYIASYLTDLGINLNLAPVADVLVGESPEIGQRSYGGDAAVVTRLTLAMAAGLRDNGVIPCYKHFPGHGALSGKTHNGPAATARTLAQMRGMEFLPFAAGIDQGVEMVMTSHLTAKGMGDTLPASLSPAAITTLLRQELGFDGVVITDALRMAAITEGFSSAQAAVLALEAGADILLLPDDLDKAAQGVLKAVREQRLTLERIDLSVERILALKIQSGIIQ